MHRYYGRVPEDAVTVFLLLMMGATDAGNVWSKLAVNKYLHTVASCWNLLIQSHDAWNLEYKTNFDLFQNSHSLLLT